MVRIPEHIARIGPYVAGKPIDETEREFGLTKVVKLASNENPHGPSPLAIEAIRRVAGRINRYPDESGRTLRGALAARFDVSVAQVVLGNGSTEIVELLARTFLADGRGAVVGSQSFIMYGIAVRGMNAPLTLVPLRDDRLDLPAMAGACDESTALVYIGNPNNPTGTCITREELSTFLTNVPEGVITVLDEAYVDYVQRADYGDGLGFLRAGSNVVILRTFSKIHGLAGLRVGYAITREEIAAALQAVRSPFNTSVIAQEAALAALEDSEHVEHSRKTNAREIAFLERELSRRGVDFIPTSANFILVRSGIPGEDLYRGLLRHGVIVRPMQAYGYSDGVRVTAGKRDENRRFLQALESCLTAGGGAASSSSGSS